MKETLIIYRDWWEAIKSLPTELQLDAWNSICGYAFEGVQPDNPVISAVTALMRSAIDRDKAKWEDVREKRREAGRRGAQATNAKRWESQPQTESPKSANTDTCRQMPTLAETTPPASSPQSPELSTPAKSEAPSKYEAEFERFRQMYPGSKRGLAVEFGNFKKKYPKTWKELLPLLVPAVERLITYHTAATEANKAGARIFVPNFAYLSTWINNARWEEEFPEIPSMAPQTPLPTTSQAEPENEASDFGGCQY